MTMQCDRCGKPINTNVSGRWVLPKGRGVETVCVPCAHRPAIEPKAGAVLIDADGNETPIDVEKT